MLKMITMKFPRTTLFFLFYMTLLLSLSTLSAFSPIVKTPSLLLLHGKQQQQQQQSISSRTFSLQMVSPHGPQQIPPPPPPYISTTVTSAQQLPLTVSTTFSSSSQSFMLDSGIRAYYLNDCVSLPTTTATTPSSSLLVSLQERKIPTQEEVEQKKFTFNLSTLFFFIIIVVVVVVVMIAYDMKLFRVCWRICRLFPMVFSFWIPRKILILYIYIYYMVLLVSDSVFCLFLVSFFSIKVFWGGGFVAPLLATVFYFGFRFWEK